MVSASPRAMFRDLAAAFGRHAGGHHQRPADHPPAHSHVQVGGARRTGRGTRCGPGGGTGTRARPRRCPSRIRETVDLEIPDSLPRARTRSPGLAGGDPLDPRGADHGVQGLVHPAAGMEQGGEERPRAQLGDRELDLAGGGGHRLEALAVAPVGALRRARRGAPRRSRRRPRTPTGPVRPGPGADAGRRPSSKVRVGKDFPDQRGHGPLVRGGHRGCTPCESWSKNLGSHDARRLHGPANPSTPRARGNCHHTKRRTPCAWSTPNPHGLRNQVVGGGHGRDRAPLLQDLANDLLPSSSEYSVLVMNSPLTCHGKKLFPSPEDPAHSTGWCAATWRGGCRADPCPA